MGMPVASIVLILLGVVMVVVSGLFLRRAQGVGQKEASKEVEFWTWVGRIGTACSILGVLLAIKGK